MWWLVTETNTLMLLIRHFIKVWWANKFLIFVFPDITNTRITSNHVFSSCSPVASYGSICSYHCVVSWPNSSLTLSSCCLVPHSEPKPKLEKQSWAASVSSRWPRCCKLAHSQPLIGPKSTPSRATIYCTEHGQVWLTFHTLHVHPNVTTGFLWSYYPSLDTQMTPQVPSICSKGRRLESTSVIKMFCLWKHT